MTDNHQAAVRRAGPTDAAELVRLRHAMFRAAAAAGAASKPAAVEDTSWQQAAVAAVADQMQRDVLAAFVVDDPAAAASPTPTGTSPNGGPPIIACAIAAVREHLPGPGLPAGLNGTMSSVYVDEPHRGRGLARAVVTAGLGWLDSRGAEIVDLQATSGAIVLYRSLGFAEPPSLSLRRVRQAEHR